MTDWRSSANDDVGQNPCGEEPLPIDFDSIEAYLGRIRPVSENDWPPDDGFDRGYN